MSRTGPTFVLAIAASVLAFASPPAAAWAQQAASSSSLLVDAPDAGSQPRNAGAGQTSGPRAPQHNSSRMDISLGVFPQLTGTRTVNQGYGVNIQGTSPSAGVLGSFHQQFRPLLGYDFNVGYTRLAENYEGNSSGVVSPNGVTSGTYSRGSIGSNVYELSAAYVARAPDVAKRLQPFAQGGGGVLIFQPTTKAIPGSGQLSGCGTVRRWNRLSDVRSSWTASGVQGNFPQESRLRFGHFGDSCEQAVHGDERADHQPDVYVRTSQVNAIEVLGNRIRTTPSVVPQGWREA